MQDRGGVTALDQTVLPLSRACTAQKAQGLVFTVISNKSAKKLYIKKTGGKKTARTHRLIISDT